ncbi:hypothetical protein NKJ28_14245 [Mesorhizobium sp. M0145]|uniref:hypothetical protein n=1 Tax=Mesorhizobium sp. M0145 TaxID=2956895 RepID=UPI003339BC34
MRDSQRIIVNWIYELQEYQDANYEILFPKRPSPQPTFNSRVATTLTALREEVRVSALSLIRQLAGCQQQRPWRHSAIVRLDYNSHWCYTGSANWLAVPLILLSFFGNLPIPLLGTKFPFRTD